VELKDVIRGCLEGNKGAWEELVNSYSRKILNMAFQFTGSRAEAEDLTQEIFLKVYSSLEKFDTEKNFTAWVLTLAKNHLIDEYRRTKWEKKNRDDFDDVLARGAGALSAGPEDDAIETDNRRILWQGLNRLPADVRMAIVLKELQGQSYEDVSRVLKLPLGTVKSRINRGKLMLARILREAQEA
jgi:RNA polymerase sigma-70 factor (ECF subfamily)